MGSCKNEPKESYVTQSVPENALLSDNNESTLESMHPVIDNFNEQVENTVAFAKELSEIELSFNNQEYTKSYEALAAKMDDLVPSEMHMLGYLYLHGYGIKEDYDKARAWLAKAAAMGSTEATNLLGIIYEKGYGVKVDYHTAFNYYSSSAAAGHALALNNMGFLYENGLGVLQDIGKAIQCYKLAADQGNTLAMNNLGWAYMTGRGVTGSPEKGLTLLKQAAEKKELLAVRNLEYIYREGLKVKKNLNEAQKMRKMADSLTNYYEGLRYQSTNPS